MQAFTKGEIGAIWTSLTVSEKGESKSFALSQLKDASEIVSEIKAKCTDLSKPEDNRPFIDGELELSTDKKKLIRDCTDRPWAATAGADVLTLREKLA